MPGADVQPGDTRSPPAPDLAARSNPFERLRHEMERLFDEFAWPGFRPPAQDRAAPALQPFQRMMEMWSRDPASDLIEREDAYEVQIELPGIEADEVEVTLRGGVLTIKGEKAVDHADKAEDYHIRERSFGAFRRQYRMPGEIDGAQVAATFQNGVLTVRLPKSAEARGSEQTIRVRKA